MRKIQHNDVAYFSPDPEALMKKLRPITTDEMLRRIAFLDYGMDQEVHFAALKKLRDEPMLKKRLEWEPKEVLELGIGGPSYSNYGGLSATDKATDSITHAFLLSCVLRAMPFEGGYSLSARLLDTTSYLLAVSPKVPEIKPSYIASNFSWLLLSIPYDEDLVFLVVWLIHAALEGWISAPTETIEALANWAYSCEVDPEVTQYRSDSYFKRDSVPPIWKSIGNHLLLTDVNDLPNNLQITIRDIGSFLAY